ncbi:hypothetical protein [Salmonirosea aquatica]
MLLQKAAASLDIDVGLLSNIERNERRATHEQIKLFAEYYSLGYDV